MGSDGGALNASRTGLPPFDIEKGSSNQPLKNHSKERFSTGFERSGIDRMPRLTSEETLPGLITEVEGDLFDARDGAALIHACNCQGTWGKGIARTFKQKYPAAFEVYKRYCQKYQSRKPVLVDVDVPDGEIPRNSRGRKSLKPRTKVLLPEGTALLIEPQKEDYDKEPLQRRHWIICLFTSRGYGNSVSSVDEILQNTQLAVANLEEQLVIQRSKELEPGNIGITELRSCRFNSGLFGVEWAHTKKMLDNSSLTIIVACPSGQL